MTIFHNSGNINNIFYGLSRWAVANTPDNPAYVPLGAGPQIPIEGIKITDVGTELLEEVRECSKLGHNIYILSSFLDQDCKDTALVNSLDEIWRASHYEGRFHLFDGIMYHRTKHSCILWNQLIIFTEYNPQTDGLAAKMIQTLDDMIRRFCAYGLDFRDSDGFTHYWCTLIPALELEYKISVHSSIGQTHALLEKGWNPILLADTLRKDFIEILPTAYRFKIIFDKVKHHAKKE
ncbi:hypothetical protein O181_018408 [Austropuccinia psidii MF-1]|uniref:Uncharacterized protein n=1 Tax=Austropuccinia psidii MF-1 TaxID=1389203 RepID=A0A9Q3C918_9BASI|nr:hypothetical protein [Austropuccinia psidii MF-1]